MGLRLSGLRARAWRVLRAPFRRRRQPREAAPARRDYPWEKAYPPGIDWRAAIAQAPLYSLLDEAAAAYPDNVCISFRGRRYRYREIANFVDRAAKGFQELGVGKGIKVGLALPNTPYAVISFYAVLKAGGTVVNLNPLYGSDEIAYQIADSGVCIVVTLDIKTLYDKIARHLDAIERLEKIVVCPISGVLRFHEKILFDFLKSREFADIPDDDRHVRFKKLIANDGKPAPVAIDPMHDVAVMQFTGGTTGFPKAARLTHANLFSNTKQMALWAPDVERGKEKILGLLPLFHAFGMTAVMNLGLEIGAELILMSQFKAAEVVKAIDRERPTVFIGVPTMFSALNAACDSARYDLSSLSLCISGGSPMPLETLKRFEELARCPVVEGYGLSEAGPVCTVNPVAGVRKAGSVGLPLPGTVIDIVALDDPERVLPQGEWGEICVTGPQVMIGYANRANENVDAFRGGWLHTGDVGYLDEDGYLYIVDRIKELIICGGFNVYPRMVEDVIRTCPAVEEAAVIGVPDARMGEVGKAFVKLKDGEQLTVAELRAFLKDRLAPFQVPRKIDFRESLPMTLIGKISKMDLIEEEARKSGRDGTEPARESEPA